MINKLKKTLVVILITVILLTRTLPVWAIEAPTAPEASSAPVVSSAPVDPPPTAPEAPSAPETPTLESIQEENQPQDASSDQENQDTQEQINTSSATGNDSENLDISPQVSGQQEDLNGTVSNGNVGDTNIETGDAQNTANLATDANQNIAAGEESGASATVENTGNGADSTNTGAVTTVNNSTTIQDNNANVGNNLDLDTLTGENSASQNVGNSSITSGDANTVGNIITTANTNMAGVSVSEFNVVDDQIGDLILDFASNCVIGCSLQDTSVINSGNGADSTNSGTIDQINNNSTFQTNEGIITNDVTLAANSGENEASQNTGGDTTIETGDANVDANILSFLNNNIAGNVILGVVNIFGDLIGDIIFPEDQLSSCPSCSQSATAINSGNGVGSTNTSNINQTTNDSLFQTNDATIQNNLLFAANTGANSASGNTGGNTSIETGTSDINANVLNIANSNVSGGDWWLVIINQAGQWIGQILGAPQGSTFAGSEGTQFVVGANGEVTAVNSGNGADSNNTSTINQTTNNTTVQSNTGTIINNIDLFANTGRNEANNNTGGDTSIVTGDAKIIANIVNFVNNNISGGGKLFVTMVNVFGNWMGNFVGPGQQRETIAESNVDSDSASSASTQNNSSQQGGSDNSNSGSSQGDNSNSSSTNDDNNIISNLVPTQDDGLVLNNSNGTAEGLTEDSDSNKSLVLSALDEKKVSDSNKEISINLAWGLLLLPLGLVLTAATKLRGIIMANL